ncbi:abscission/NoCut checkpoint regulator-like [Styela clava]
MDKRCRVCTSKFGIFRKEVECERCRIALCKECRSCTLTDPKEQKTLSVCKKCHTAVTSGNTKPRPRSPPMNFKREMEAKEKMNAQKRHLPKQTVSVEMSDEDLQLAERFHDLIDETSKSKDVTVADLEARLSKLTADEKAITQQEIEYRLAKLKGNRPPVVKVHSIRKSESDQTPSTSSAETPDHQMKKLIRQYTEEVAMETNYDPFPNSDDTFDPTQVPEAVTADSMILLAQEELKRQKKIGEIDENMEGRLKTLQGMSPQIDLCAPISKPRTNLDDLSDEEELELIKRLTAEAGLEVSLANRLGGSTEQYDMNVADKGYKRSEKESSDLPWCIICNEDASLRCHGCEGDLYCLRCFKEGHDSYDLNDHKTSKYSAPKNMDYD